MIQFAFWASLILTFLKIIEVLIQAARSPRLDVRLTSEAFFRLNDHGETLFCNSVLLAWNGPVLILDSRATLEKTDSPTKAFPFKILEFGEKVKGSGPFPDHYFHSRSPISHLAESDPQRALYFCVQEKYEDLSRKAVAEFRKQVLDYKQELLAKASSTPPEERAALSQEILRSVNRMVDGGLSRMMELIQLEPGSYKLTLQVDYQNPKSRFRRKTLTSASSIAFLVGSDVRDTFRINLRQALLVGATNLVLDQQTPIFYPEYAPLQVKAVA